MVEIPRLQAKRSWAVGSLGERRPKARVLGAERPRLRLQSASAEQRTPRLPVEGRSVIRLSRWRWHMPLTPPLRGAHIAVDETTPSRLRQRVAHIDAAIRVFDSGPLVASRPK